MVEILFSFVAHYDSIMFVLMAILVYDTCLNMSRSTSAMHIVLSLNFIVIFNVIFFAIVLV